MTGRLNRNEAETRSDLIDPALEAAGWGKVEGSRIRREYPITKGTLLGNGRRAQPLSADYILIYKNKMLAVVEAKRENLSEREGLEQAKDYAKRLDIRFTYATNGKQVYGVDMLTGEEGSEENLPKFPTPDELWAMTYAKANEWRDRFADIPFETRGGTWELRYYQNNAVERTLKEIAKGKDRLLLTLATGTGKTAISFQLAWKLFYSNWNLSGEPTRKPRILFLADRNILANQAFNSFSAFPEDALVRINPKSIKKKGSVPKNGSVFFTIFQTFMSGPNETPYFGEYKPDFFDFIIIDECHRGGRKDESAWKGILEYFSPAVQLGLTATPKRDVNGDTYEYFGKPIYEYSLKEGINDGFLTPFRVREFATTMDDYTFTGDDEVVQGDVDIGDTFEEKDFNKRVVIEARERKRVKLFMNEVDQKQKAIVFCENQPHAAMVRDLINQEKQGSDTNYCVRVCENDGEAGEQALRDFQDNDKTLPTMLTTSTKLSTGVDATNVRNIILLRPCNSMVEFKQIVGRGTRLHDGKDYFTIYDFVKASKNFKDPDWDGDPVAPEPRTPVPGDGPQRPPEEGGSTGGEPEPPKEKIVIKLSDGKERQIQHMSTTTFWSADGRPMSAAEFIEKLYGELPALFRDEDELRGLWSDPDTRSALMNELSVKGFGKDQLDEIKKLIDAEKSEVYDVLSYIAYTTAPLTREERAKLCKDAIIGRYEGALQEFLEFVLTQYVKEGVGELNSDKAKLLIESKYHTIHDAINTLGDVSGIRKAFVEFQRYLYAEEK